MKVQNPLLVILGPTATGKTTLAAQVAFAMKGEVISADSRQIYTGMTIGTGKDLDEFRINDFNVPYHLIDIHPAGFKYNVYEYQHDFIEAYNGITDRGKLPVMCGGSGMYIESILGGYKMVQVPVNTEFRNEIEKFSDKELTEQLGKLRPLHNTTDTIHRKRLVRALEIARYEMEYPDKIKAYPQFNHLIFGIDYPRPELRKRITERLRRRIHAGMLEEVKGLLEAGISESDLIYYGLEYKFITQYILGRLSYDEMFERLNTGIHQFAKRQVTWFRKMERNGYTINWLPGEMSLEEKIAVIREKYSGLISF